MPDALLSWRIAATVDHDAIEQFVCTDYSPPLPVLGVAGESVVDTDFEGSWEYGAQAVITTWPERGRRVNEWMLLGMDRGEIAAAAIVRQEGPIKFFVVVGAVALSHRGRRPRVGDALFDALQDEILIRTEEYESVHVFAKVHRDNAPSLRLAERSGMACVDDSDLPFLEFYLNLSGR